MQRWALLLEYDGAPFIGWQHQKDGLAVQDVLEQAASHLASGHRVPIVAAGRTDAGVHAEAQVVHLDLAADIQPGRLRDALNFYMKPHPVAVRMAARVAPDWSARFSAVGRAYRYIISDRHARPALSAGRVWHGPQRLDAAAMAAARSLLLGHHDFTSFRASACQAKSPLRTLDTLDVRRDGEQVIVEAAARSFLHHQVRNLVGTLKLVGEGRKPIEWVAEVLAAKDRRAAGPTAPPDGLFLIGVRYPADPFT